MVMVFDTFTVKLQMGRGSGVDVNKDLFCDSLGGYGYQAIFTEP